MSKVDCRCGNQISDVAVPCPDISLILSDDEYDHTLMTGTEIEMLRGITRFVWHCRDCGRIAIEDRERKLSWFKPDPLEEV